MKINTQPNLNEPDEVYQALLDAHAGLSDKDSRKLNAKLILLLANHIGDRRVIDDAIEIARDTTRGG